MNILSKYVIYNGLCVNVGEYRYMMHMEKQTDLQKFHLSRYGDFLWLSNEFSVLLDVLFMDLWYWWVLTVLINLYIFNSYILYLTI